jgi:uncharacterized membrane protein YGL010W
MKKLLKSLPLAIILSFGVGGCLAMSGAMCYFLIQSWSGGAEGRIVILFNFYGERLTETILCFLWTATGIFTVGWCLYQLGKVDKKPK